MMGSEEPIKEGEEERGAESSGGENGEKRPPLLVPPRMTEVLGPGRQRLHSWTLAFVVWNTIRTWLVPAVIILILGTNLMLAFMLAALMVLSLVQGFLRYFTYSYRIEGGELITRQGILERTERHIPLARVQDIRLEQGILHRLVKMVDVHIETAGGQGPEAQLSVLSRAEAERLRAAVFEEAKGYEIKEEIGEGEDEGAVVRSLSSRELIVAGLTSNQMASAMVVFAALFGFFYNILPEDVITRWAQAVTGRIERWLEELARLGWFQYVLGGAAVVGAGLIISAIRSLVLFYGFRLSRRGEDLHRVYGLFTRRGSNLPRGRIQLLKVEEGLLRRVFGLATLRADTAGGRPGDSPEKREGRDVLLPILRREEVEGMLPYFFPDWEAKAEWQRVSTKAIWRGTFKGTLVCLIAANGLYWWQQEWTALWPLAFLPLVYLVNVLNYRHLGYVLGENYFRTRRGWLSRATHIVPIRNMQSIVVHQTPFDRRHGVATLIVDTAGQAYTGGGPRISNVPFDTAREIARVLARKAASVQFRW